MHSSNDLFKQFSKEIKFIELATDLLPNLTTLSAATKAELKRLAHQEYVRLYIAALDKHPSNLSVSSLLQASEGYGAGTLTLQKARDTVKHITPAPVHAAEGQAFAAGVGQPPPTWVQQ